MILLLYYCTEEFEMYWNQLFFESPVEFCTEIIWSWAFLVGRLSMNASISLGAVGLFLMGGSPCGVISNV